MSTSQAMARKARAKPHHVV